MVRTFLPVAALQKRAAPFVWECPDHYRVATFFRGTAKLATAEPGDRIPPMQCQYNQLEAPDEVVASVNVGELVGKHGSSLLWRELPQQELREQHYRSPPAGRDDRPDFLPRYSQHRTSIQAKLVRNDFGSFDKACLGRLGPLNDPQKSPVSPESTRDHENRPENPNSEYETAPLLTG